MKNAFYENLKSSLHSRGYTGKVGPGPRTPRDVTSGPGP